MRWLEPALGVVASPLRGLFLIRLLGVGQALVVFPLLRGYSKTQIAALNRKKWLFPRYGGYSQSVIHLGTNIILLIILNYIISNSKKIEGEYYEF